MRHAIFVSLRSSVLAAFLVLGIGHAPTLADENDIKYVPPPRSIGDITAILDNEKPDPKKIQALEDRAKAQPKAGASKEELATFFMERARAREWTGRIAEALADTEAGIEAAKGTNFNPNILVSIQASLLFSSGEVNKAYKVQEDLYNRIRASGKDQGTLFRHARFLITLANYLGNFPLAQSWAKKNEDLWKESQGWKNVDLYRAYWEMELHYGRGLIALGRGDFGAVERNFRVAVNRGNKAVEDAKKFPGSTNIESFYSLRDSALAHLGNAQRNLGRTAEAEANIRFAVMNRLKSIGKYNLSSAWILTRFAMLLNEQGRYQEGERIAAEVLRIYETIKSPAQSTEYLQARDVHAGLLSKLDRWKDALAQYEAIDKVTASWPPERGTGLRNSDGRAQAFLRAGDPNKALQVAVGLHEMRKQRFGEKNFDTAVARGYVAAALARLNRNGEAMKEFNAIVPIMLSYSRASDSESESISASDERRQIILENYIALLARVKPGDQEVAFDTFRMADRVRVGAVHKAFAASSARAAAKDPALADLARREQDLEKGVAAMFGGINNALATPSEQRDGNALREMRIELDKMRTERARVREEIQKRFPDYAALIDPRPPTAEDIKAALRPGEAFITIYLGGSNSFAWAVPKDGPIQFTAAPLGAKQVEEKVNKLRLALEPKAETLEEIPVFDLALAHEIYSLFLKPIEGAWKPAKSLVVTTNGALGLLPLGLLPTAPAKLGTSAVKFEEYKSVPWLAKTHAVAMVPSASALKTLRNLPGSAKNRETLIGFGDPFFSAEQAKEAGVQVASAATATRGTPLKRRNVPQTAGVNSAELALLPRLPDTAEELKSIAGALQVDVAKAVFLGREANEKRVKTTNLMGYKIVAFATHGLVPGELDGLTQPALAMTAPAFAGIEGDGLLTMEDILSLKLDADWVVLSACNTGAGSGAGAEAASGLGRAFFYAGTRALLVTNWSVHSVSARELVTDLFARQAKGSVSRAEALRQASVALLEGPGYVEGGRSQFSYAHPLFWAPYTIIGDGGGMGEQVANAALAPKQSHRLIGSWVGDIGPAKVDNKLLEITAIDQFGRITGNYRSGPTSGEKWSVAIGDGRLTKDTLQFLSPAGHNIVLTFKDDKTMTGFFELREKSRTVSRPITFVKQ